MKKVIVLFSIIIIIFGTSAVAFAEIIYDPSVVVDVYSDAEVPTFATLESITIASAEKVNEEEFLSHLNYYKSRGWPVDKVCFDVEGEAYYVIYLYVSVEIYRNGVGTGQYFNSNYDLCICSPLGGPYILKYDYNEANDPFEPEYTINQSILSVQNTIDQRILGIQGYVININTKLTTINQNLATFSSDTDTNFRALFGYVDELEGKVNGMWIDVRDIESALGTLVTNSETQIDLLTELTEMESASLDLSTVEDYLEMSYSCIEAIDSGVYDVFSMLQDNVDMLNEVRKELNANGSALSLYRLVDKIYTRLGDIEDAVVDAGNIDIDISTDNDAFNIFYVEKTDGTSESVGVVTKDAAVFVGDILSMFYRLVFSDALDNVDILEDFEGVYSNTEVSVW